MKIKIEKTGQNFQADCVDLPGSPPVGRGFTKEDAVANLFLLLMTTGPHPGRSGNWVDFMNIVKTIDLSFVETESV